jgi:predicted dienelactone hydrolase
VIMAFVSPANKIAQLASIHFRVGFPDKGTATMKVFLLLLSIAAFSAPALSAVGFEQFSVPDPARKPLSVAVWFPSVGRTVSSSVGPFQQMVVPDGTVLGAGLPLVLISHGSGGSNGSHYDTALALASAGFVVVALTHTGDNYMDQSYAGNREDLTDRPRQVRVVLSYMLTSWTQHDRLDAGRVGMFGFSLGGFTTLVAVGGIPDLGRMRNLCTSRPTAPECLFIKQRNGDQLSPAPFPPAWIHDQRVKAAVVAAPAVSYLFGPGSLKDVKVPIQLWRASNDDQVPDAWNTALIREDLAKPPDEHVVTGAGHYVFLPPCSEALAKQAPQICTDRPGFDRHAFHLDFNREVVAFFKKAFAA